MRYERIASPCQVQMVVQMLCLSVVAFVSGCGGQSPHPLGHKAEANPAEADIVAEIEELGGEVTIDAKSPDESVSEVRLTCCNVTDACLERLKGLARLRWLSLNGTNVTDADMAHLKGMTSLEGLSLYDTLVTDAGLQHLKGLPNLQSLNLTGTQPAMNRPGSARAYSSRGLTRPNSPLRRPGTIVTDAGLEHIKELIGLQCLSLENTQVTDTGLRHLAGLKNLGTLDLRGTDVTDAGLEHLKRLARLQDLLLSNTKVTDAGLEHLKGMTSLQWLAVGGSLGPRGSVQVTDTGLEHLKGLTNLFYLGLWGTQVSAEGVQRFRRALPRCHVDSPYGDFQALVPQYREIIPGTQYWRLVPGSDKRE